MTTATARYGAEFIGTFILVVAITGATVVNTTVGGLGVVGTGIVPGLVVAVVVQSLGSISGAHVNPVVTLALVVGHRFAAREALPYVVCQLAGGVAASLVVRLLFGPVAHLGASLPRHGAVTQAFWMEVLLTFILVLVILGVTARPQANAAAYIGAVVAMDSIFGGPISGASMNPARSFGPALVSGDLTFQWVYWVAPILGSLLAVWLFYFFGFGGRAHLPAADGLGETSHQETLPAVQALNEGLGR